MIHGRSDGNRRMKGRILAAALALAGALPSAAAQEPWPVDRWTPPFDYKGEAQAYAYAPLEVATRPWRLCASYPHLKDSYWLSVNYGMVQQAKQLGVHLHVVEAGGYPNLARQREQIEDCVAAGAEALIVGTVSFDGLTDLMVELSKRMPIVAAVNDIADPGIAAKAAVS